MTRGKRGTSVGERREEVVLTLYWFARQGLSAEPGIPVEVRCTGWRWGATWHLDGVELRPSRKLPPGAFGSERVLWKRLRQELFPQLEKLGRRVSRESMKHTGVVRLVDAAGLLITTALAAGGQRELERRTL